MKLALAYFVGMCTASSYWAAAMWGTMTSEDSAKPGLWALAVVMTAFSIICAAGIASKEKGQI